MNRNVWLIALCNATGFCATPLMMFVGSIVGVQLAPTADLATLPIACMVIGTAVGTLPVSLLMSRLGRQTTYLLFIALGAISCYLASIALSLNNFVFYSISSALIGMANAALQHLRFTAMESVSVEKGPTAASIVLCGGIFAAFIGPELAIQGQFLTATPYQGSFWLVGGCFVLSTMLLFTIRFPADSIAQKRTKTRPMIQILYNPEFCLAVGSAAIAFTIMSFVMTAAPISMHHHHGLSLLDTKWVIQSHIAAMFLPSLISPLLLRLLGIRGLMVTGLVAYSLTIILGFIDTSTTGYWYQLVLLGIGWNFLFIAGTSLLPRTYREGEQFKARALNDGLVFSAQAIASLSAGWVISTTLWQNLLLLCVAPILLLALILLWARMQSTRGLAP